MAAACDLLEAEIALDRIDAELAVELPPHMRAFAAAYAANTPVPAAPEVLRRGSTLRAIEMCRAHPVLADRVLAIARLAIPIAIEDDPRVIAARAAPSWDALATLTAARDTAARERFGTGLFPLVHRLFGVGGAPPGTRDMPWPAPVKGWHDPRPSPLDPETTWTELAARYGAEGRVDIVRGDRARTFVVEPGRHAIVVVPPLGSLASQFALLHELGHALVALLAPAGVPRVVDEAAASYIARGIEHASELAVHARRRRLQLAEALDAIERGATAARPTDQPPWALWHDPGAQAAYVEAEAIADRWCAEPGPLAAAIARERARVDHSTSL